MGAIGTKHYCHADWKIEFDLPGDWAIDPPKAGKQALTIAAPVKDSNPPTVILELDESNGFSDISELMREMQTDLSLQKNNFQLLGSQVLKPLGDQARGFLLFKYNQDGKNFICQKVLLLTPKKKCLSATASSCESSWPNNKTQFQVIINSLKPFQNKEVEIVFESDEVEEKQIQNNTRNNSANDPDYVVKLLSTEYASRNLSWFNDVLDALNNTPLYLTSQSVIKGPDGFSYYALFTRQPAGLMVTSQVCIPQILNQITDDGLGLVIDAGAPHVFSFSFGEMWYAREHGGKLISYTGPQPNGVIPGQLSICGSPSDKDVPAYARRAIKAYMKYVLKMKDPSLYYSQNVDGSQIYRYLTFNVFRNDYRDEEAYKIIMNGLSWHLPPHIWLAAQSKRDREVMKLFSPI